MCDYFVGTPKLASASVWTDPAREKNKTNSKLSTDSRILHEVDPRLLVKKEKNCCVYHFADGRSARGRERAQENVFALRVWPSFYSFRACVSGQPQERDRFFEGWGMRCCSVCCSILVRTPQQPQPCMRIEHV